MVQQGFVPGIDYSGVVNLGEFKACLKSFVKSNLYIF